jgi:23S rRNA pseudouridine955/2504/2580 synthase
VLRVPPGGEDAPAGEESPAPRPHAEPGTDRRGASHGDPRTPAAIVLNKPPGLATQGGSKTPSMSTACSMPLSRMAHAPPAACPPARQGYVGRAADRPHAGQRGEFLQALFASRSARKVYWALVVGVPDLAKA